MPDVIIIGAGAAGIAAGRRLAGSALDLLVLEASDRVGGRGWTRSIHGMPLDLGCGWLHSADRNAWARLAAEWGWKIDRTPPAWQKQYADIGFTAGEQQAAGDAFAAFDRRLRESPPASDRAGDALEPDGPWNEYLQALSGFINGAELGQLSVRDYLAYSDADTGCNWRLPDGYGALIAAGAAELPITFNAAALEVDWSRFPIRVRTSAGSVEARAVLIAVPSDSLAKERLRLTPALPDKLEAASRLPLGLANKAFLALDRPEPFEPDTQLIGNPHLSDSGAYYLRPFGRPAIECFFGGAGARALEAEGEGAASAFAVEQLVDLLGSGMRRRLRPIAETGWGADPWIGGSYSHALPGHAAARAELARPVQERLFFAGEACSTSDFSTAHGAWESGVAAAEAVLVALGLVDSDALADQALAD